MPSQAGSTAGALAVMLLPSAQDDDFTQPLNEANRRLSAELLGSSTYASFLANGLTVDESDAIHRAANLLAVGIFLQDRVGGASQRGITVTEAIGDGAQNTYLTPDQTLKLAARTRDRALRELERQGLWTRYGSRIRKATVDTSD